MTTPIYYVLVHRPEGDSAIVYKGMSLDVISNMLNQQNLTGTVVTQEQFDAYVTAHQEPL